MATTPVSRTPFTKANTTDNGQPQADARIVGLNDGGYVVLWEDYSGRYSEHITIVGRKYNAQGQAVTGEIRLGFDFTTHQDPAVTSLPGGGFGLAFQARLGSGVALVYRQFDANLNPVQTTTIEGTASLTNPSITALADGSVLMFATEVNTSADVHGYKITADGEWTQLHDLFDAIFETDRQSDSTTARLSNGNVVLAYVDEFNGSVSDTDVKFVLVAPSGHVIRVPTVVAGAGDAPTERDARVAALAGGGFVVTWSDTGGGDGGDVRFSILANDGTVVRSGLTAGVSDNIQSTGRPVALKDGGFVVTWFELSQVKAQRFDSGGNAIGDQFIVRPQVEPLSTVLTESPFEVALLASGRFAYASGIGDFDSSAGGSDIDASTSIWDPLDARNDLSGDGRGDILWRNTDGSVISWKLGGGTSFASQVVGTAPGVVQIAETGDLNGDGRTDILFRNTSSGDVVAWLMNANGSFTFRAFGSTESAWRIAETGDINRDGRADIIFHHTDGTVVAWLPTAEGGFVTQALGGPNSSWQIAGMGDFNHDLRSDLLWRGADGSVVLWLLNETGGMATRTLGAPNNTWRIEAVGDFNRDATSDIAWRNTVTGEVVLWLVSDGATASQSLGAVDLAWDIVDAMDVNADGRSDLLWRHSGGQVVMWELTGGASYAGQVLGAPDTSWQIFNDPTALV